MPHLPNMTAVGATTLFTGAKFGTKKSIIILFTSMLIVDCVKGLHSVMWATYGSLVLAVIIGGWVGRKQSIVRIVGGTLISSIVFFLITNFAVWLAPNFMYQKTIAGLVECYVMAIPFFRSSLIGDLTYISIFFGGYELVSYLKKKYAFRQIH